MAAPDRILYLAHISFRDHWGKLSPVKFLTSQSEYTGWLADTATGNLKALFTAISALSLCTPANFGVNNVNDIGTAVVPASEYALNNRKLLVNTMDSVNGYPDRFYIPGPDGTKYSSSGGQVDITNNPSAEITALLTAVANAAMQSRYGHGVVVVGIKPVGRHLHRQ